MSTVPVSLTVNGERHELEVEARLLLVHLVRDRLGLTGTQSMTWVVLPQALRNMVPALVTQMIVLFKDTSLASIIGYLDLTKAAQIVNNREIRPFELYLFIAVVYWVCTYSMSVFARRFERLKTV